MSTPNREALGRVATKLGDLADDLVFIGGRIVELLVTDPVAYRARPTLDSDAVCEAAAYVDYHQIEIALERLGFRRDTQPGAPMCRWMHDADVIDVMPDDETVLRFKNRWYGQVLKMFDLCEVVAGTTIRIAQAPVFLATKWDAFEDRGRNDWYGSADIEDIVNVVAGRAGVVDEIGATGSELREYLVKQATDFVDSSVLEDVIAGALPDAAQIPGLLPRVSGRFSEISRIR